MSGTFLYSNQSQPAFPIEKDMVGWSFITETIKTTVGEVDVSCQLQIKKLADFMGGKVILITVVE